MAGSDFNPWVATGKYSFGGREYEFAASVKDANGEDGMFLVSSNIELAEYDTQLNGFLVTGKIIYQDADGNFGKLFTFPHLTCSMYFKSDKQSFAHSFIVNKIELLGTEDGAHRYSLELVSVFWYSLVAIVHWSNYADKKPMDIVEIIYNILSRAVGTDFVDKNSFISQKSGVSIYYTTHENDNAMTAITYLFNRLYMEPRSFNLPNQLKSIVFDTNAGIYRLLNLGDDNTYLETTNSAITFDATMGVPTNGVSFFEGRAIGSGKRQAVSLSNSMYTSDMPMYFTRSYWDLSANRERLVHKYVESDRLIDIFTDVHYIDGEKRPASFNLVNSENKGLLNLVHQNGYIISESAWSNRRRMYTDLMYRAMYSNAFGIQQEASADHQAGSLLTYVAKTRTVATGEGTASNDDADSALRGTWLITRAKHILVFKHSTAVSPLFLERMSCVKYNTTNKSRT